jgi:hypothetical protein
MYPGHQAPGTFVSSALITYTEGKVTGWQPGWIAQYYCASPDCPQSYSYWWAGERPDFAPCPGCGQIGGQVLTLEPSPLEPLT